ncbi:methylamine utilization protein [Marinimicrobium alkaliphilum]|uniref:methylamine utilization protein n=1 Tax=Marinimicrobium alkaliphilum TaxID=2202654 RepID=UPI000DB96C81|nr:methylamine utilization protein [Marinimicrobium alkaliphilum]
MKRLWLVPVLLFVNLAWAVDVEVRFTDDREQPLRDAVVALVPEAGTVSTDEVAQAVMDQRDIRFVPHVIAVRRNTAVSFPNSDNIRHHVYSFSPPKRFELRLYHGTPSEPVVFDQTGQVVIGCNIHDTMLAYIYVVDTDWFGVSGDDGRVELADVPPGNYQLEIYHPRYPEPYRESVTLNAGQPFSQQIQLSPLEPGPRERAADSELERLFRR